MVMEAAFNKPEGIRGWLLIYVIMLAILLIHGLGLTVASIIVYYQPSLADLDTFGPFSSLLVYVISNLILAAYTIVLYRLMYKKKKAAILHNHIFNLLSILFLIGWNILGLKSDFGTFVDSLPGLVGIGYFLVSKRVRNTFVS